jgi:soluble lytic murein transglycosylase
LVFIICFYIIFNKQSATYLGSDDVSKFYLTGNILKQSLLILLVLLYIPSSNAEPGDDEFLKAREAYDNKNVLALADSVTRLQNQNYILSPYADYWLMLLNLDEASNQSVQDFLTRYSSLPFANRLRGEWLKKLAKQQNWSTFLDNYTQYQLSDAVVTCYAAQANAAVYGPKTLESAKSLWLQAKDQPSNCDSVFDMMQEEKILTEADIVKRLRMALTENKITLAKAIAARGNISGSRFNKSLDLAYSNPQKAIKTKPYSIKDRYGKELYLYALYRIARTDSLEAVSAFKSISSLFSPEEQACFYGNLALLAAKRHEPEALKWFQLAQSDTILDEEQLDWYARSALRQLDWPKLIEVTQLMPPSQKEHPTWRYWRGRALKVLGQTQEANSLFARLSTERHFYGWLANEELESSLSNQPDYYTPTDEEVSTFASLASVKRAEALLRKDFRWEAKMEWVFATEGLDDRQLITAAEYANRQQWYDLAVITADKTTETHNFALRYPTPYRELMKPAARLQNIDEAWAYGIIRQESRFMHYAKSHVGASGLMQVMPATAKWIAKKIGWRDYHNGMIHELDTNISLGTYYLGYTLEQFNGQEAMATAAYNAGPSRARKWADDKPLEGAIYAETIPFNETRTYVKRVMENANLYAAQLGLPVISLKSRLGVVAAKVPAQ